jgi:hypothetical protein
MMNTHRTFAAAMLAAASLTTLANVSRAYTFTEDPADPGGDTLATAAYTISDSSPDGGTLTAIDGSITSGTEASLFTINITAPTSFYATTNNALTNAAFDGLPLDTELFLLDGSGNAVAVNDDAGGAVVTSTLPQGSALYANLTPGLYYLGISISGNEPVNSVGQLLFAQNDDSTAVRGAEGNNNTNPTTLSTFDLDNYDDETGAFEIDLGSVAAIPEPSSWVLASIGALAVGCLSLRRKSSQA